MYQPGDDASHLLVADGPVETLICEECGDERALASALRAGWIQYEGESAICPECQIAEARGIFV